MNWKDIHCGRDIHLFSSLAHQFREKMFWVYDLRLYNLWQVTFGVRSNVQSVFSPIITKLALRTFHSVCRSQQSTLWNVMQLKFQGEIAFYYHVYKMYRINVSENYSIFIMLCLAADFESKFVVIYSKIKYCSNLRKPIL